MRKFFVNKAFAANRRIKGMSTVIKDIPIDTTDEAKLKAIREKPFNFFNCININLVYTRY